MMLFDQQTDAETTAELGRRLARLRINADLTQAQLAERAGVTRSTVQRFERGGSIQLESLIKLLRPLGRIDALAALLPEEIRSPIAEFEGRGKERKRVRARRGGVATSDDAATWSWGDETAEAGER